MGTTDYGGFWPRALLAGHDRQSGGSTGNALPGHLVCDPIRGAALRLGAIKHLAEGLNQTLHVRLDPGCIVGARYLGRDVDDAAAVDDVIGRVENAPFAKPVADVRRGELVALADARF